MTGQNIASQEIQVEIQGERKWSQEKMSVAAEESRYEVNKMAV